MGVGKAPLAKLVAGIFFGPLEVGRASQARTGNIAEISDHVHYLRVVKCGVANAAGSLEVHFLLRESDTRRKEKNSTYERRESSGVVAGRRM